MQARLMASFAALPISFIAIPYVYWRSRQDPWWSVLLRPLVLIFASWATLLFIPSAPVWAVCFGVIIWVSLGLKDKIIAAQPPPRNEEPWRR